LLKELLQFDVDGTLKDSLREQGWHISPKTLRWTHISKIAVVGVDPDNNWIFPNHDPSQKCKLFQTIVIKCNIIPKPCLGCWKVVVHPKNLLQLMQLLKWQEEYVKGYQGISRFCKCGIEERDYVPYNFGAYFYCESKEEGLARKADVRKAVDLIDPSLPVILKRYCTEFEIRLGPSDKYKPTPAMEALEEKIFRRIDVSSAYPQPHQPKDIQDSIKVKWIKFAWGREDPTAIMFNDGEPLYTPAVTY